MFSNIFLQYMGSVVHDTPYWLNFFTCIEINLRPKTFIILLKLTFHMRKITSSFLDHLKKTIELKIRVICLTPILNIESLNLKEKMFPFKYFIIAFAFLLLLLGKCFRDYLQCIPQNRRQCNWAWALGSWLKKIKGEGGIFPLSKKSFNVPMYSVIEKKCKTVSNNVKSTTKTFCQKITKNRKVPKAQVTILA